MKSRSSSRLFFVLMAWHFSASCFAQSNDDVARFVDPDTALVANLNVEKLRTRIDWNDELAKKLKAQIESEQTIQLDEMQRLVFTVRSTLDPDVPMMMPFALLTQFASDISKQDIVAANNARSDGFSWVRSDAFEQEVYVTDITDERLMRGAAIFFPAETVMVNARRSMIEQMIGSATDDSTFGARMVARINPSAELHLILDGQRIDELVKRLTVQGVDIPMMLDPRLPAAGLENPYEHLERMEVVIDLENMIPIQISLQMKETEKAETVEQLFRALQLTGPGMIDQQLRLIEERDPLKDVYREFLNFAKKALQEVQIIREDKNVEVQLAAIENIEKLPHWVIQSIAPREVDVSGQELPESYRKKTEDQ